MKQRIGLGLLTALVIGFGLSLRGEASPIVTHQAPVKSQAAVLLPAIVTFAPVAVASQAATNTPKATTNPPKAVHRASKPAAKVLVATPDPGVRTVGELNCPAANVEMVAIQQPGQTLVSTVPICYQPPDGDEVAVCIAYHDNTWTDTDVDESNQPNMGCPIGSDRGYIDPDARQ